MNAYEWAQLAVVVIFTAAAYVAARAFVELLVRADARCRQEFGGRRLDRWT